MHTATPFPPTPEVAPKSSLQPKMLEEQGAPSHIVQRLEYVVKRAYPPKEQYPYHCYENHIPVMLKAAGEIMDRLENTGHVVDRNVVNAAILLHDALLGADPRAVNFKSAEELAAYYSEGVLKGLGASPEFTAKVVRSVRDTHVFGEPESIESKVVRQADLSNVRGDFSGFIENTLKLHAERIQNVDPTTSLDAFILSSVKFLGLYLERSDHLLPQDFDERGTSLWHRDVLKNVVKLFQTLPGNIIITVALGNGSDAVKQAVERQRDRAKVASALPPKTAAHRSLEMLIVVDETMSPAEVRELDGGDATVLYIPGRAARSPIPEEVCGRVVVADGRPELIGEAQRIIGKNGLIAVAGDGTARDA